MELEYFGDGSTRGWSDTQPMVFQPIVNPVEAAEEVTAGLLMLEVAPDIELDISRLELSEELELLWTGLIVDELAGAELLELA